MNESTTLDQDREILREILSRDEFKAYHETEGTNFLMQLIYDVLKWFTKTFFNSNMDPINTTFLSIIAYVIVALIIVAFIGTIYWFVKQMVRHKSLQNKWQLTNAELSLHFTDYIEKAREAEQKGDYRGGLRFLFLSFLFFLHSKKWIQVEKWKTNWEYVDELNRNRPAYVDLFKEKARLFERVWYGQEIPTQDVFLTFLTELEEWIERDEADEKAQ
ncbi:DUF4129 domain-containing protein [Caldalkalibacillus mannanilyticus]|uniref:DUF4129 domain-containing protein n=1 Tax=Caldalkalibacillus mannanilyticus TaxID=1418 RepID=UPI000469CF93|nr:DUF4129 domain-containing protein [Caldalkalibacillus mannanilyticus]